MRLFNLQRILLENFYIIKSEPINYRWGGNFNFFEINIILNDFAFINLNILFLKLKKIISLLLVLSYNKGICVFFFLNFFKFYFLSDLSKPKLKNFYIVFIDKAYSFLSKFKFFLMKYKKLKYYTNYGNPIYGSNRYPSIVFISKKSWKNYIKFFYLFIRLRLMHIKSNSIIDIDDNSCFNIFINDCKNLYIMFKSIYCLTNKYFKIW